MMKYSVIKRLDLSINQNILDDIYSHLLSYKSVVVYNCLAKDANEYQNVELKQLVNHLNMDINEFQKTIDELIKYNLLLQKEEDNQILWYPNDTLSYREILHNEQLYREFVQNVNKIYLNKINQKYGSIFDNYETKIPTNNKVCNDNTSRLIKKLNQECSCNIELNNNCAQLIESICCQKKLSDAELIELIKDAVVDKNTKPHFSYNLLLDIVEELEIDLSLPKIETEVPKKEISNPPPIKKKPKIAKCLYDLQYNLEELHDDIEQLKTLSTTEYLNQAFHQKPKTTVTYSIKKIKTEFQFEDDIINVLIDYCLWKNDGKYVENYVLKIAETLKNMNLNDIECVIEYLRNIQKKPNNVSIPQSSKSSTSKSKKEKAPDLFDYMDEDEENYMMNYFEDDGEDDGF